MLKLPLKQIPVCILIMFASLCYADSTEIKPLAAATPQTYQADVDTSDCTDPIKSTPYIIVLGNGGANMDLTCPKERPVMYNWHQEVGFGGPGWVSSGGGNTKISCCALKHSWQAMG
jgi:hypothetical protein